MDLDGITLRQREIVKLVGQQSYLTLETLALRFDVSIQSIRRDVIHLDRLKLLQRFHGGAGATEGTVRLGYGQKREIATDAKARIAQAAVELVPGGSSIFLDVGTTTEALAGCIGDRDVPVRVFTNSLAIGMVLAGRPQVELHVFGGTVRGADGSLVGAATLAAIDAIGFDVAFIGCSGFDGRGRATDFDLEKIAVKQAAMQSASASVLLADATKFPRHATAAVAPLDMFSCLITDATPTGAVGDRLADGPVRLVVA